MGKALHRSFLLLLGLLVLGLGAIPACQDDADDDDDGTSTGTVTGTGTGTGSGTGTGTGSGTGTGTGAGSPSGSATGTVTGSGTGTGTGTGTGGGGGSGGGSGSCWQTPDTATTDTVLITEVVVMPTDGEFIEIYNGTGADVDLSDYYVTDGTHQGSSTYYYNIVTDGDLPAGGGTYYDFHARFPAGATIGHGEYQIIALDGSDNFYATYGCVPTYELYEDAGSPDAVPDMLEAFSGSINPAEATLTNDGETVVLYYWDGATDLVGDVDYLCWGTGVESSYGVDKSGVSRDGPDGDDVESDYEDETATDSQEAVGSAAHAVGNSFSRVSYDEGTEADSGGNGITGHDETSENLETTFDELTASPGGPAS